jgi:hypothetical protein
MHIHTYIRICTHEAIYRNVYVHVSMLCVCLYTRVHTHTHMIFLLRQDLSMYLGLASNLRSSCLCLQSAGIIGMYHHAWFI